MRSKFLLLIFCLLINQLNSQTEIEITSDMNFCQTSPWEMVFNDEFNGNSLDTDNWYTWYPKWPDKSDEWEFGRTHGDREGQIYRDENAIIENGILKLRVKEEQGTWYTASRDYTSGMIYSKSKFRFGKIEIKCKIPYGQGFWPAFWTFKGTPVEEIDIFEFGGDSPSTLYTNLHSCYGEPECSVGTNYNNGDFSENFYTIGIEWDPHCIRWYVDDDSGAQTIRIEPKYSELDGTPITDCAITSGTYLMNPQFPTDPTSVIANLAIAMNGQFTQPPNSSTPFPSDFEIDYIRIYSREICDLAESHIRINNDEEWNEDRVIDWLKVEEDQTLTINNATIRFEEDGDLFLDEGAKLILNNSKLISCSGEKWNGVKADDNAIIKMYNSRIENARIGVNLGNISNGSPNTVFNDRPTLIMQHYSGFKDCDIGVQVVGLTDSRLSGRSWFEDNDVGILAHGSSGMIMDRTEFYNNNEAIRSIDSYMHIRDGNSFHGGDVAISLEGTFPLSSGIDIGDEGKGYNFFANNRVGIEAHGNDSPAGSNIVNCRFDHNIERALNMSGANDYTFANNNIDDTFNGVVAEATGDNFNYINCNIISNIDNIGCMYLLENKRSTFLENEFNEDQVGMVAALNTELLKDIGVSSEAAANCFSDVGYDIISGNLPGVYFPNYPPGQSFNYHFADEDNCQEPTNDGNYEKFESEINLGNCENSVGIFDDNIVGSGGGSVSSVIDTLFDPSDACLKCIKDSINHWVGEVINIGGDDPGSLVDEEDPTGDPIRQLYEETMTEWINYGIFIAIATNNTQFGEDILAPLHKWRWQKRLFGFKILMNDIDGAQRVLDGIDVSTTNRMNFRTIQRINMKRLRGFADGNYLSQSDLDQLSLLAQQPHPSSGYARSLYRLLAGDRLPYNLPVLNGIRNITRNGSETSNLKNDFMISPNPTTDQLFVTSIDARATTHEMKVVNLNGIIQNSVSFDQRSGVVDVSNLPKGIYIIKIYSTKGQETVKKFIKQ